MRTRELSTEHTEIIQEVFPQRVSLTGRGSRVKEEPPKEGAAAKGAPASANGRCKGPGVMKRVVEERPTSGLFNRRMGHTSGCFKRFVEKDENRSTARDAKQLDFGSEGTSITNVRQMQHFRERPPATGG